MARRVKLTTRIKAQGALISAQASVGTPTVEVLRWQDQVVDGYNLGNLAPGSTFPLSNLIISPVGTDPDYATLVGTDSLSVDYETGLVTVSPDATPGSVSFTVGLLDGNTPEVTSLGVSSLGAWTFGQGFKQGDAPQYVVTDEPSSQVDVRTRWPDGSVKFAVISAIGTKLSTKLLATTTAPASGSVALPVGLQASVTFSGEINETVDFSSVRELSKAIWSGPTGGGLVRTIPGPIMTEYHYYAPLATDAHLTVWWYIRAYSNGATEVETVVENGWLKVSTPIEKYYGVSVSVGGTVRYSTPLMLSSLGFSVVSSTSTSVTLYDDVRYCYPVGARVYFNDDTTTSYEVLTSTVPANTVLTFTGPIPPTITSIKVAGHFHHTRWSRVDWVDPAPVEITPTHDVAYLKATKLIPNYGDFGTASTATFALYSQTHTPMQRGSWRKNWDDGGDGDTQQIGLLPPWEALYFQNADVRAYQSVIANGRNAGSIAQHYRDETTGRALNYTTRKEYSFENTGSSTTTVTSGSGPKVSLLRFVNDAAAHSASFGYVPHLLTGRWLFLDEAELVCGFNFLDRNAVYREKEKGTWHSVGNMAQTRSLAWGIRQQMVTLNILPEDARFSTQDTDLAAEYRNSLYWNVENLYASSVAPGAPYENSIGLVQCRTRSTTPFAIAPFEFQFLSCVLAWMKDTEVCTAPHLSELDQHCSKLSVGIAGGYDGGYCFRNINVYTMAVCSTFTLEKANIYSTFEACYTNTIGTRPSGECVAGGTLVEANTSTEIGSNRLTYSYAGQCAVACAYAVDHGVVDAVASYARITGSSTWTKHKGAYANSPKWGIVPR